MDSTFFIETSVTEWTVAQLSALPIERLQSLTRRAVGTLAVSRLLVGRCILALEETGGAEPLGFSGALHFVAAMGLELPEARKARRVARQLEGLPLLRQAAEAGNVGWASLTAFVSKATPETEADWLAIARVETYHQIRRRVARTDPGERPAVLDEDGNAEAGSELRLTVSAEILEAFRMVAIEMSEEAGRRLPTVEVFERLVVGYCAGDRSPGARSVEAVLSEARKNLAAVEELESRPAPVVACEETPPYVVDEAIGWLAAAAEATPCPGEADLSLVAPWRNKRLRFQPSQRLATAAQRRELLRRDGFRCSTPGCPHHLWLDVHHIVFYCDGGKTVPDNLIVVCSKCHRNIHNGNLVLRGTVGRLRWEDRAGVDLWKNAIAGPTLGILRCEPTLTMRAWDFYG